MKYLVSLHYLSHTHIVKFTFRRKQVGLTMLLSSLTFPFPNLEAVQEVTGSTQDGDTSACGHKHTQHGRSNFWLDNLCFLEKDLRANCLIRQQMKLNWPITAQYHGIMWRLDQSELCIILASPRTVGGWIIAKWCGDRNNLLTNTNFLHTRAFEFC